MQVYFSWQPVIDSYHLEITNAKKRLLVITLLSVDFVFHTIVLIFLRKFEARSISKRENQWFLNHGQFWGILVPLTTTVNFLVHKPI